MTRKAAQQAQQQRHATKMQETTVTLPTFATYAEAAAFLATQQHIYGAKAYTATPEYHALYPIMCELATSEQIKFTRKRRVLRSICIHV